MAIESTGMEMARLQQGPLPIAQGQTNYTIDPSRPEQTFADTLKNSIREVNLVQEQADQAIVDLTTGKKQDLHQTMVAIEKADVTFQLMMQVRNKIISAYEEVSRMQI